MFRKLTLSSIFVFCLCGFAVAQSNSEQLQVLYRPAANYTDEARQKDVEGSVYLKVTFLASGEIGDGIYIKETSKKKKLTKYGLVEQAMKAAKRITFKPASENGEAVTVTKTVVYTFTLY